MAANYYINGIRYTYSEAVVYLLNSIAAIMSCALDELTQTIRNLLRAIKPGSALEFRCITIARERLTY